MSNRLDDIRARAEYPTDGFFATADGRDQPPVERVPQIVTYFKECPEKIATSPATLVERADVLLLLEIADAANALDGYEDFGEPFGCEACSPDDPVPWNAARRRLYDALGALREQVPS